MAQCQSLLPILPPPPGILSLFFCFWNSCTACAQWWVSCLSQKKTHCGALKSVQLCFTLGQRQKEIPVFHFPVNVS